LLALLGILSLLNLRRVHSPSISDIDGELFDGLRFCTLVYQLFESIRQTEEGKSRLRMRTSDTEKKLVEELLPISRYVQLKHGPGRYISVKWLSGDQQYDAELHQSGWFVEQGRYPQKSYIEVTCVMHPNDYLMRELLDTKGGGFSVYTVRREKKTREISSEPHVWSNFGFVDAFVPLIVEGIKRKSEKGYPAGTVLIVACSMNFPYLPDEWSTLIGKVRDSLPNHSFSEIFLHDPVGDHVHSFYGSMPPAD
jgi:hypothetical protein